jgi:hypothetical protein
MSWTLVIVLWSGMSKGYSASYSVPGFTTEAACVEKALVLRKIEESKNWNVENYCVDVK